ncbi:hypothetical protein FGG08_006301 [Glutinoglossum americanum]|uniref:Uncharacterized protein n=1 Tax=Glutinoglossum americanum TaxID=1670608 RepID=A0A9P8KV40_9PEZI|nr:hypothetical protein FGG08_006301 [Glutinoglossum americanum]
MVDSRGGVAFSNSSSPSLPTKTTPECGLCTIRDPVAWKLAWKSAIATTITAATVIVVVDRGTNATSTTTEFSNATKFVIERAPTNDRGTAVTTLTVSDSMAHTQFTTVIPYPNAYVTYDYDFWVWGTFQITATNNVKSCVTATGTQSQLISLPSHPPFTKSYPATTPAGGDDRGNNFVPMFEWGEAVDDMFPDVGMLHSCIGRADQPFQSLTVASFLTETSTHYRDSGASSPPQAQPETSAKVLSVLASDPQPLAPLKTSVQVDPVALPAPATEPLSPAVGTSITAPDPSNHPTVGIQILSPGGPAVTTSSTPVGFPVIPTASRAPLITLNGQIITPDSATHFVIGSQTLILGGPAITVSGTPISIPTIPSALAIPRLTIGDQVITQDSATHFIIGTRTLIPGGPAITISGTLISVEPGATVAIIGTSTVGLGSWIESGFSGLNSPFAPTTSVDGIVYSSSAESSGGSGRLIATLTAICLYALAHSLHKSNQAAALQQAVTAIKEEILDLATVAIGLPMIGRHFVDQTDSKERYYDESLACRKPNPGLL